MQRRKDDVSRERPIRRIQEISKKRKRAAQDGQAKVKVKVSPLERSVDPRFVAERGGRWSVYQSPSGDVYDCMLNQTNIDSNNNKFYRTQVVQNADSGEIVFFTRWGRVGNKGQTSTKTFPTIEQAVAMFEKKFLDKTKNDFADREEFVKHPRKYDIVHIDVDSETEEEAEADVMDDGVEDAEIEILVVAERPFRDAKKQKLSKTGVVSKSGLISSNSLSSLRLPDSALPPSVQRLVEWICDVQAMQAFMIEMDLDVKRLPLGKLSKKQLKKGYGILKKVEAELGKDTQDRQVLLDLSNQFYTAIPHAVGMKTLPILDNHTKVLSSLDLLKSLGDIEVAVKLIGGGKGDTTQHPVDAQYNRLKCGMSPLAISDPAYQLVSEMVRTTHGPTHDWYTLSVEDVFVVNRESEYAAFQRFSNTHNRRLLWHGSRITNFAGIFSQGLRIAPPEAPVTGYMFGKGVYFADSASKSANYCHANEKHPYGLLLLCDVALGDTYLKLEAEPIEKLKSPYLSTMGVGELNVFHGRLVGFPEGIERSDAISVGVNTGEIADISQTLTNTVAPIGPLEFSGTTQGEAAGQTALKYNEYVVYSTDQVIIRYAVKVKFHFT